MTVTNNYDKVHGSGVANVIIAEPKSGRKDDDGKFIKTCPTAVTQDGWTIMTWRGENGGPGGYALTNGVSALLFDENGNCKTSTGKPGDTGCGGKIVRICTDFLDKGHSYAGQFTGSSQERSKEGKTEELPTYSLHVTGETAIESVGGDVNILGDNVTIQARKTLTLKAGTAIAIEAGSDKAGQCSGSLDIKGGKVTTDASFISEKSRGHHKEIKGEFTVNQDMPGSGISFNTNGSISSKADGNYDIGCKGRFNIDGGANVQIRSKKGGSSLRLKGKYIERIGGTRYTEIKSQSTTPGVVQMFGWEIKIANAKKYGMKIKSNMGLSARYSGGMSILKFVGAKTKFTSSGPLNIKGNPIYLN